jgi:hypothetical protein
VRAYLIDPMEKTILEIGHNETMTELYGYLQCTEFEILRRGLSLHKGDGLYVDAKYRTRPCVPRLGMFSFKGVAGLILGKALISGHTVDGEMCDPRTPLNKIRDLTAWR